ncbi:hypothetical protein GCM10025868_25000 [Angustibacter aerolatus]|uniref:Fe-S oxidoreductase n=1 Tax=Angustibacter aerolatus TaxID=1162965 RepID=A0ABQ6JKC9_9ACTN|nr:hypothetical protein [Angustibacter aerolatus]GMA87250.1 hypothetical protein GCM10025868_25000 [Angustibacter aerolatus]
MQTAAIAVSLVASVVGFGLLTRTAAGFVQTVRLGQPDPTRTGSPVARTRTLLREFLGHTRMAKAPVVAVAHWFVMVSFGVLFFSLVTAYGRSSTRTSCCRWSGTGSRSSGSARWSPGSACWVSST